MEPFIGTIMMFAGNYAPAGWALCNGQLLAVSGNSALFSIIGTFYGGDGRTTFGLPDLRCRTPIHAGTVQGLTSRRIGQRGGAESVTLTTAHIPPHSHLQTATDGTPANGNPSNRFLPDFSGSFNQPAYADSGTPVNMGGRTADTGGGQPVEIIQPYIAVSYIIALQGVYPTPPTV